jgi:hypothetical protein
MDSLNIEDLDFSNIEHLKYINSALNKGLVYEDENEEKIYKQELRSFNHGFHTHPDQLNKMEKLETTKLNTIKNMLVNDPNYSHFLELLTYLNKNKDEITENINKKKDELTNLIKNPPNDPNYKQQLYSQLSFQKNSADKKLEEHTNKVDELRAEIYELTDINYGIEFLAPIYLYQ